MQLQDHNNHNNYDDTWNMTPFNKLHHIVGKFSGGNLVNLANRP